MYICFFCGESSLRYGLIRGLCCCEPCFEVLVRVQALVGLLGDEECN